MLFSGLITKNSSYKCHVCGSKYRSSLKYKTPWEIIDLYAVIKHLNLSVNSIISYFMECGREIRTQHLGEQAANAEVEDRTRPRGKLVWQLLKVPTRNGHQDITGGGGRCQLAQMCTCSSLLYWETIMGPASTNSPKVEVDIWKEVLP